MAQEHLINTSLRLAFLTGVDLEGESIYKSKTFNNIKSGASASKLLAVAEAIASVQGYQLETVVKNESAAIFED